MIIQIHKSVDTNRSTSVNKAHPLLRRGLVRDYNRVRVVCLAKRGAHRVTRPTSTLLLITRLTRL